MNITRRRFSSSVIALMLVFVGCTDNPNDPEGPPEETPTSSSPTPTGRPTETPEPDGTTDSPGEETPTPHPDSLSYDVLQVGGSDEQIEQADATASDDYYRMAYLDSEDRLGRLDEDSLGDDERTFLDETDFDSEAVVALWFEASAGNEPYVTGVLNRSDHLETRVWIDYPPGPATYTSHLVLVRVEPEGTPPKAGTVVIENDWRNDFEPTEFGTTDE